VGTFLTDELAEIICQDVSEGGEGEGRCSGTTPPTESTHPTTPSVPNDGLDEPLKRQFETTKLVVDRRLLLNRARKLKMYRIWLQVGLDPFPLVALFAFRSLFVDQ
jgi:hypothetical protein